MRKCFLLTAAAATFAAQAASPGDHPAGKFEIKLSSDQRVRQAINRLSFGARSGDFEAVQKLGVEKWIEIQLHPERIPESSTLEAKLKPFESIRMEPAEVFKEYYPQSPLGMMRFIPLNEMLPADQVRQVLNGTAEERRAAILALDPEKRANVLAVLPPNVLKGLPDLEAEKLQAIEKQLKQRVAEARRIRPPLTDLLNQDQMNTALRGSQEARAELFASLDAGKLQQVAAALPPSALAGRTEMRRTGTMLRNPQQVVIDDLREAKVFRAIYSSRQLEEVLTDFWFNHFNVFEGKNQDRALLASYERDAIRPHVLGKFRDLLLATARHPAMLDYLDNWQSMSPDVFQIGPFAPGPAGIAQQLARQAHGLNENYGRELLELHTLGVDGGYTQQDVIAAARCFTGWTIRERNQKPAFVFAMFMHDTGEKVLLGHKIPAGGGEQDGLQAIEILARYPSTARFISTKLARRFVADDPPPALIDRMARTFIRTDGDLRAVLEILFTSRELFSEGAWQSKIKSPLEMVVSAVRAVDADVVDTYVLAQKISDMGEPLYGKEPPTGYKDAASVWLSTANVITRVGFATELALGNVAGAKVDPSRFAGKDLNSIARQVLNREPSERTMSALQQGLANRPQMPNLIAGLVISSPDFQRR